MKPRVTVFIPTLDAGDGFDEVLDAILGQRAEFEFEVRAIDSGSTDGTQERLGAAGIEFRVIDRREFDHGETRNAGVREARGELVALLSQDARPDDEHWLARLAEAFEDPRVAGSYAAQIPRADCHPFQRINVDTHMREAVSQVVREPLSVAEYGAMSPLARLERIRFDNVSSMVRRSVILEQPFPRAAFGEDLAWSRRVLLGGHRTVFCRHARVRHSHAVTRREFGLRVRQAHEAIKRQTGFVPIENRFMQVRRTAGTLLRFWRSTCRTAGISPWVRMTTGFAAVPYALLQMNAMYAGGHAVDYEPPA